MRQNPKTTFSAARDKIAALGFRLGKSPWIAAYVLQLGRTARAPTHYTDDLDTALRIAREAHAAMRKILAKANRRQH